MKLRERTIVRLLPGILLVAILVSVVLGSSLVTQDIAERQGKSYLEQAAERKAEELGKTFERERMNMETIAHMTAHIMEYEFIDTEKLVHLTETTSFDGIEYIHVSGNCYGMDGSRWDVREKAYFQDAMLGNSGYAFDEAKERGQGNVLLFYAPIKTDDGDFDGILCGYLKESEITSMLDTSFWGHSAQEYLCTKDGVILVGSTDGSVGSSLLDVLTVENDMHRQGCEDIEEALEEGTGSISVKEGDSIELVELRSVPEADILLVDTFPSEVLSELYAPVQKNLQHATLTVCGALLLYVLNLIVQSARNKKRLEEENEKISDLLADTRGEAEHDPLTGLLNRRGMSNAVRIGIHEEDQIALVLLDVDHFKGINDTYGHTKGDGILKEVGRVLKEGLDPSALICRMGGDEFVVILRDRSCADSESLKEDLERINGRLKKGSEGLPSITLSIGVAFSRSKEGDKIFYRADEALYEAKRRGRDCVCIYEEWIRS